MASTGSVPTLSAVRGWDTAHLTDAATQWTETATVWEDTFTRLSQSVVNPGGTPWFGEAADTAQQRAYADRLKVISAADQLHAASAAARGGAGEIRAAKQAALAAVQRAEAAGFTVGEDFSVTSRETGSAAAMAARQAQAQTLAADIRSRVGELIATDQQVAGRVTSAATGLGGTSFGDGENSTPRDKDPTIQMVDHVIGGDAPQTPPQPAVDPHNPYVGDERFGHWENVVPPPYTGSKPPPPWTGHRSLEGFPGKGPAGPSGFYVPGGKNWADDNAPPMAYLEEQYRFRITGQDYTGYTRMVNGQQQQWVQYTYEAQRFTQVNVGGPAWAPTSPDEIARTPGGTMTGGLAGITPPPKISAWQPISLPQISSLSAANPTATYYIPDGCGGQFTFSGGVPVGGMQPPPVIPSMTAGP